MRDFLLNIAVGASVLLALAGIIYGISMAPRQIAAGAVMVAWIGTLAWALGGIARVLWNNPPRYKR